MTNTQTENHDLRESTLKRDFERAVEPHGDDDGSILAQLALEAALGKKGLAPVLLDMREMCSYTNFMLIISGRSDRQVDAIAEAVRGALRSTARPLGTEGLGRGQWALLDYGDLIVHVFHHPVRLHYDLEGLWIDAKRVEIDVPPEAMVTPEDEYAHSP